jgi:hypothetical protein
MAVNFQTTNPAQLNDRVTELQIAVALDEANVLGGASYTAAGAISVGGSAVLKAGSAAAMTLAAPIAGSQLSGGQDFAEMVIFAADAYAYTVTTPTNALNGNKHIATFAAAAGNAVYLEAFNGVWYVAQNNGITLS